MKTAITIALAVGLATGLPALIFLPYAFLMGRLAARMVNKVLDNNVRGNYIRGY